MLSSRVERISLPAGSLAAHALARINYTDSYRIQLPPDAPHDVDHLFEKTFSFPPSSWIARLMRLRNKLVTRIGLKAVAAEKTSLPRPPFHRGDKTRFLKVVDRVSDELLLGEDDKHLDLRVSVLRQEHAHGSWLVVTTVVQFNNWLGRLYFGLLRPFHQRLMPWMMKKAFQAETGHPL